VDLEDPNLEAMRAPYATLREKFAVTEARLAELEGARRRLEGEAVEAAAAMMERDLALATLAEELALAREEAAGYREERDALLSGEDHANMTRSLMREQTLLRAKELLEGKLAATDRKMREALLAQHRLSTELSQLGARQATA
jgi:hypothetical protein